jgi:chemotaxis protein MotB
MDLASFYAVGEVVAIVAKEVEKNASEVEEFVFKNKLAGQVDVSSNERGAIITISDTVLFPSGKSRMTSMGNDFIKQVFDFLQHFNYNLKIEGHKDNSPIRIEQFPSNWKLSAARAAEVARELVEAGFPPHAIVC